jgi:hypothetical protein
MKVVKIGDKQEILKQILDSSNWENLVARISTMSELELQEYHNTHFSELKSNIQEGIWDIEKALWGLSKKVQKIENYLKC